MTCMAVFLGAALYHLTRLFTELVGRVSLASNRWEMP